MYSVNYKNKNLSEDTYGHRYNRQHIVLVSKYGFKVFKNLKTQRIIKTAIYKIASANGIEIKESAFGDDYAHTHGSEYPK
ncbi:MAG: transposase [Candidatus Micrarchaeia archaeon]